MTAVELGYTPEDVGVYHNAVYAGWHPETGAATWLVYQVEATYTDAGQIAAVHETMLRRFALPSPAPAWPDAGHAGVLILDGDGPARFHAYPEAALRLVEPDGLGRRWGWYLPGRESLVWTRPEFVPGRNGEFVEDETEPVELAVPPEFFEVCDSAGLTPEAVLRGFIADLCALQSDYARPRADGYSSNGSDERRQARAWFERAYSPLAG